MALTLRSSLKTEQTAFFRNILKRYLYLLFWESTLTAWWAWTEIRDMFYDVICCLLMLFFLTLCISSLGYNLSILSSVCWSLFGVYDMGAAMTFFDTRGSVAFID